MSRRTKAVKAWAVIEPSGRFVRAHNASHPLLYTTKAEALRYFWGKQRAVRVEIRELKRHPAPGQES